MNDLAKIVGLEDVLREGGLEQTQDFESAYSSLKESPHCASVALELERRVRSYFEALELPSEPTLYDHLVLCLRPKDVIATFNWDPLLVQACARNADFVSPPRVLFLHGNTGVAVCRACEIVRPHPRACRRCGRPTEPIPLLYPIQKKNYASNNFIAREWEAIRGALKDAYILTIFGYSAPASDMEAVSLLQQGWGSAAERNLEQIELIDIKSEEETRETWRGFIHTEHYQMTSSFYSSWIARFPRRTCEAMWAQLMELQWLEGDSLPNDVSREELHSWFEPLVAQEQTDTDETSS